MSRRPASLVARASCPCETHGRNARATTSNLSACVRRGARLTAPVGGAVPVGNRQVTASGPRSWPWIIWAVMVALQFLAIPVVAADKLEVDLIPAALRVRGQAPIPVQARFRWNGTQILEGHLEVELHEGNRVLSRYHSGDLALTTGGQTFRMLLPPCEEPYSDSQVEAQTKFVTAKQVFDLGYSILFVPTMRERSFVLGWCSAHFGADQQSSAQRDFLFERLAPPDADAARKLLVTSVVRLDPEDLPAQPLAYTSFDVMILTADAFKEAREGQLRALTRWVKGGGSVCVFVTGGLRAHHVSFLNELAGSSTVDRTFVTDSDGNLVTGQNKISRIYSGMGRCVVVAGNSAADPTADTNELRQAVAFLWKFRARQMQAIAQTGHWEPKANDPSLQYQRFQQLVRAGQANVYSINNINTPAYSTQPSGLGPELMQQLMPRTVRLIPFSALMGTLGVFLLMIGPVDYFVLGWLRRRRYTWVLFPATSIVFMIATVLMANYFLGLHDQRRSLIVVDLNHDGTALRWNRFELVFTARDKQVVTELKDALWAPIDFDAVPVGLPYNQGYPYPNGNQPYAYRSADEARETGPPWYDGAVPVHFRTSQSINQWQPKLNRIFSFEPPPVPLLPNWAAIEATWPNVQNIQAKLSASKISANVCSLSDSNSACIIDKDHEPILSDNILNELCEGDSTGLLSIVSQVSPTGGGNFEDAQGMDVKGGDSVLAIVTRTGDDIVVYRRFFHGK